MNEVLQETLNHDLANPFPQNKKKVKFRHAAAARHTVTTPSFCEEDLQGLSTRGWPYLGVERRASGLPELE